MSTRAEAAILEHPHAAAGDVEELQSHRARGCQLEVDHGGTLVTREPTLRLRGRATDDQRVRDLYIFVGARKVFYQPNDPSSNPREASFDTRVPLSGGINYVTVFVRESDHVVSRRTLVVRRDAADGALMETPGFDEEFGHAAP